MHYKIVKDNTIVDAMEEVNYVRQNLVNKVVISCRPEVANGIVSSDGSVIWHLEGCPQFVEGTFATVKLIEIDENEYNTIKEVLVDEEVIEENDERIRQPMTTMEVLEKFDALQKQVEQLTERNIQLEEEIKALKA